MNDVVTEIVVTRIVQSSFFRQSVSLMTYGIVPHRSLKDVGCDRESESVIKYLFVSNNDEN